MDPRSLETTRRIEGELEGLERGLRARLLFLGLSRVAALFLSLAVLLFLIDRAFTPPLEVRWTLLVLSGALLAWVAWRYLVRPLRVPLGPTVMALALERRLPELAQRLVSAVQLGKAADEEELSPGLVQALLENAADRFQRLPRKDIFQSGPLLRWGGSAAFLAALAVGGVLALPAHVGVFAGRMLGGNLSYPRATHLFLVLPKSGPTRKVREDRIIMARGADLPAAVRVEGVVPDMVWLVTDDGTEHVMAPKEARLFRFTFRGVTRSFSFHARGGDDPEGDRTAVVEVVDAPAVASIEAHLTPPAYTGLGESLQEGGAVEALAGTRVRLVVAPTRPVVRAEAAFDSGVGIPLKIQEGGRSLEGAFTLTRNDRYRIHLEGREGLQNVRPGSNPVVVVRDTPPRVRIAAPEGNAFPLTLKGALPLRLWVTDNFGVTRISLVVQSPGEGVEREKNIYEGKALKEKGLVLLEPVSGLLPGGARPVQEGDTLKVRIDAMDNAAPRPSKAQSRTIRVDLSRPGELLHSISDRLRRQRTAVESARRSQDDLLQRLKEALDILEGGRFPPGLRSEILAVQGGQSRLTSVARRLRRELTSAFDVYLFGGALPRMNAEDLRERYRLYYSSQGKQTSWDPLFYLSLHSSRQAGEIDLPPSPARVLDMIAAAWDLESKIFPRVEKELSLALTASRAARAYPHALKAREAQVEGLKVLIRIEGWLQEWNEFDDIVLIVRDLLEAQKKLLMRTDSLIQGKPKKEKRP